MFKSNMEDPVMEIEKMRQPYHLMDITTKKQVNMIAERYHKINDRFLKERIKPRMIIFMEDGTSLSKLKMEKFRPDYEKRGPNNVAININTFVAKYDFDIAKKLKQDAEEDHESDSDEMKMSKAEINQTFKTNAILEILQICSNELAKGNEYYQSLWTLDGQ